MAGKVTFGPFRDTFTAPPNEDVLGQARVGIYHLYIGKLNSSLRELFNEILQFTICKNRQRRTNRSHIDDGPPEVWTFSTLSLLPASC